MDNRCVRISDIKQKVKWHPDVGTYISEEDIDLMERIIIDGAGNLCVFAKSLQDVNLINSKES